jgi:hypothetical protein
MKNSLLTLLAAAALGSLSLTTPVLGQSFSEIQGKWTLKKNSSNWGEVTQHLELKDERFTYKVVSRSGETLLAAKGSVKVERLGPFKVMRLTDIQGGYSENALEPVYDDRAIVYTTGWNSLTVALNFDRARDGEDPEADTYRKVRDPNP